MAFEPIDTDGLPTLSLVYTRRCAPCARLARAFCPHVIETVPWQPDDDDTNAGERDVQFGGPPGPLLSPAARAAMFEGRADLGDALPHAPVVVGIDPGGGGCYTAGVALLIHARGVSVVGICASTRPGSDHLVDAALFIDAVATRFPGRRIAVYLEMNLGAAVGKIADETMARCHAMPRVHLLREPGQPVVGLRTVATMPQWFAGMLHQWVEVQRCVTVQPDAVVRLGDAVGVVRDERTPDGRVAAAGLLAKQLGHVQRDRGEVVFKRGEGRAGDDDLFFAFGMALRAAILSAPDYAATYGGPPHAGGGTARLSGFAVVGPESLRYLYMQHN